MPLPKANARLNVQMPTKLARDVYRAAKKASDGGEKVTQAQWVRQAIREKLERDR